MNSNTAPASHPDAQATGPLPVQPIEIDPAQMHQVVGDIEHGCILRPGRGLHLCTLSAPEGALMITKDWDLALTQATAGGRQHLYRFAPPAPAVWDGIERLRPGLVPGRAFTRFCILEEANQLAYTPHYGLLDLRWMDVLLYADLQEVHSLRAEATRDPARFLRWLAAQDIAVALRGIDPEHVGAVAEHVVTSWMNRLSRDVPTRRGHPLQPGL